MPNFAPKNNARHTTADWVRTLLLTCIPIVGFICVCVWAFSSKNVDVEKKHWARATLVIQLIAIVLTVVLSVCLVSGVVLGSNSPTPITSGYPTRF